METMPVRLQYVMRTISPTPHFVSFARAVLFRGADITLVWRPLVAMLNYSRARDAMFKATIPGTRPGASSDRTTRSGRG
jgi:hypothetical protein